MLRAMEPEDLDVLYSIENDIELWSAGYTTVPYSRYILHDYIANATCDIYADRQVRLMAVTSRKISFSVLESLWQKSSGRISLPKPLRRKLNSTWLLSRLNTK